MYYCGIDVAKRKHAISLLDDHGQPVQRPFTIENTRAGFDHLRQALAQLMDQVQQHLTSIPGVRTTTVAALLAEIGNVHRIDAPEKLVVYAGIDATAYQTGQFEAHQRHMRKRGSPYLRHALWQAATISFLGSVPAFTRPASSLRMAQPPDVPPLRLGLPVVRHL